MKRHQPTTRNKIGIVQEDYISFLGCSLSALAMYETRQRSLPTGALIRHGAIETALNRPGMDNTIAETEQALKETSRQLLEERKKECSFQLMKMHKELDKIKQQYQCSLNMLHLARQLPTLLEGLLPNNKNHNRDMEWLDIHQKTAYGKLKQCCMAKQQLMQLQIDALQVELVGIQELLDTMQA